MASPLQTRIKLCMDRKPGLRPAEIARLCRVKPPSVWGWINGDTKSMSAETSRLAAVVFGCDQNWLATGAGSPNWRADAGATEPDAVDSPDAPAVVERRTEAAAPAIASPDAQLPDDARVLARHFNEVQGPSRTALFITLLNTIQQARAVERASAPAIPSTSPSATRNQTGH
jgi:hypothetical protein